MVDLARRHQSISNKFSAALFSADQSRCLSNAAPVTPQTGKQGLTSPDVGLYAIRGNHGITFADVIEWVRTHEFDETESCPKSPMLNCHELCETKQKEDFLDL